MDYPTYRKLLADHGLRLRYIDSKKRSEAVKCYYDDKGVAAAIVVIRKKGKFSLKVFGAGKHRPYFKREARVLRESLAQFGEASIER